jgi:hypothetical protein
MALQGVFIVEVTINLQTRTHKHSAHPGTNMIQCNSYQITKNALYMNSITPNITRQFVLPHFDGILKSYMCSYK